MQCSFIDTGTDAVLCTDECNIDQLSVQDTKASITTAGGHVLKAMSKWTLTKYVTYAEYNVLQINIQDAKQGNDVMILLKRKQDQFQESKQYKGLLVMDGSTEVVGSDVFDTYSPVIYFPSIRMLINLAFGSGWEIRHWDISVAFTNALPEEPIYVLFPKNMPDDVI